MPKDYFFYMNFVGLKRIFGHSFPHWKERFTANEIARINKKVVKIIKPFLGMEFEEVDDLVGN